MTADVHVVSIADVLRCDFPPVPVRRPLSVAEQLIRETEPSFHVTFTEDDLRRIGRAIEMLTASFSRRVLETIDVLPTPALVAVERRLDAISGIELGPSGTYLSPASVALHGVRWGFPFELQGRLYSRDEALRYLAAASRTN